MTEEYVQQVREYRERKDNQFRSGDGSPLTPELRGDSFPGLSYFPVDPEYWFQLPLAEHENKERITVETTADGQREYLKWGEFTFERGEESFTLQAYREAPESDHLWVPFRDGTNGEETYAAGRYIDLSESQHRTQDGWVIDFNLAYNPTCAYNELYDCPLIPMENWLEGRIEAGEKAFAGDIDTDTKSESPF